MAKVVKKKTNDIHNRGNQLNDWQVKWWVILKRYENPWLKSEIGIRRSGISFKMSADEQTEYVSVRSIYITLLKNIVILREDGTVGKIKLRPYQRDILDNFMGHRFNILMSSRQSGKTISASIFYTTLYLI
jgi:hypothetical protein